MNRTLQPELLDLLPPDDARAIASRHDVLRLNRLMRHPSLMAALLGNQTAGRGRFRILEMGAGDGEMLLLTARQLGRRSPAQRVEALLVDRHRLLTFRTETAFQKLNWTVHVVAADVFEFLRQAREPVDIIIANLFLHHFTEDQLKEMLALASRLTRGFIALEPHRTPTSLFLSRFAGLLGCNSVTRHDARVSVEAGFDGKELSTLWPKSGHWQLEEGSSGLFTHQFTAAR